MSNEYDPKLVIVTYGALILNGYADGDFISVSYLGDGISAAVGAQGDGVLIDDHDKSAEITVRLMASNDAGQNTLSALLGFYNAGNFALPLAIVSATSGESLATGACKIKLPPDASFSKGDFPVREITFVTAQLNMQTIIAL